jgi:hypothetical protein
MTTTDNRAAAQNISRAHVEKALWELTGFQGDQTVIDGIMVVADAWNACTVEALAQSSEAFRDGYYHALVTMAEAIIDTGGRMRMVPPEAEPVLYAGDVDALAEAILRKLPDIQREKEGEHWLANSDLQESLEQMRRGETAPEVIPSRDEVAAARARLDFEPLPMADPSAGVIPDLADDEIDKFMEAIREDHPELPAWDEQITCTRCGETKHYLEYHKDSKGKHGRKSRCKECESTRKSVA